MATQRFFIFTPKLGEDEPILTIFLKMGWNHQPDIVSHLLILLRFFIGPSMTVQQRKDLIADASSGPVGGCGEAWSPRKTRSSSDSHQGEVYNHIPVAFFSCIRWLGGGFNKIGETIQFDQ